MESHWIALRKARDAADRLRLLLALSSVDLVVLMDPPRAVEQLHDLQPRLGEATAAWPGRDVEHETAESHGVLVEYRRHGARSPPQLWHTAAEVFARPERAQVNASCTRDVEPQVAVGSLVVAGRTEATTVLEDTTKRASRDLRTAAGLYKAGGPRDGRRSRGGVRYGLRTNKVSVRGQQRANQRQRAFAINARAAVRRWSSGATTRSSAFR